MALTPEEQAELQALRQEFNAPKIQIPAQAQAPTSQGGLSPEEQAELASLRNEFGGARNPGQSLSDLPKNTGVVNEGVPQQTQPQRSFGEEVLDRAQTQLENFGNTVSMGYLPQIQAAFEKLGPNPTAYTDEKLRKEGFVLPEDRYVDMRDQNIKRQQAQNERNPYDAAAGTLTGIAVSTPVTTGANALLTGGKAAKSGFSRLKDSARLGAVLGLVANPGDIEGVVNPLQATERLENTAKGGALGAAGQGIGEGAAKVSETAKSAPAVLDKVAKTKAFKAMGAMLKDFRMATGQNAPEEIGDTLLKKNIVSAGDTLEQMAEKAGIARQETGQKIRDVYGKVKESLNYLKSGPVSKGVSAREQKLLDMTKLDGKKLADTVNGKLSRGFKNNLDNTQAKERVQSVIENLKGMGDDIDLQDLIDARRNLDESINYSKKLNEQPVVQQQLKTVRDVLHKSIQNRVRVVGKVLKDKELINELKTANKEYGHLATAERVAKDKIARESANRYFSLGDRLTSGAGATIGAATGDSPEERIKNGLIGMVTGAAVGKVGRHSLPVAARTAQKLGEALKKPANFAKYGEPLIEAAKRSPEEFQALLNQLGKEPEFQMLYQPAGAR
jgi:hypothetical protein